MWNEATDVAHDLKPESKTKRSFRRFRRRIASARRSVMRQLHNNELADDVAAERVITRIPTRQEKRVTEALEHDLLELESA